jgi:hypothetical protein
MKTFVCLMIASFIAPLAFADDWELLSQAKRDAEQAYHSAEAVHQDHAHNCGGHAGKAAELSKKAKQELEEAEKYLREHPNQKG